MKKILNFDNVKYYKTKNGITLVALIITIIVLLILAVVTISAVNEGSLFSHANNAATTYSKAQTDENTMISNYLVELEKHDSGTNGKIEYYYHERTDEENENFIEENVFVVDYGNNKIMLFTGDNTESSEITLTFHGSADVTIMTEDININLGNPDTDTVTEIVTVNGATTIYEEDELVGYIKEGKMYLGTTGKNDRSVLYYDLDEYFSLTDSSISSRFVYE